MGVRGRRVGAEHRHRDHHVQKETGRGYPWVRGSRREMKQADMRLEKKSETRTWRVLSSRSLR